MFDLEHYLERVPSWNRAHPKFMATLAAVLQPFVDAQSLLADLPSYFDLDTAIGKQLDVVGEWVNRSRYIPVPLANLWFSLNILGKGLNQGIWKGPYDPGSGLTRLDDETYRRLLRAVIDANNWDGSLYQAQAAIAQFFDYSGTLVFTEDRGDMSVVVGFSQVVPSVLDLMLLARNYLPLKAEGVKTYYLVTSVNKTPLFGLNVGNEYISGLNQGSWGVTPEALAAGNIIIDYPESGLSILTYL